MCKYIWLKHEQLKHARTNARRVRLCVHHDCINTRVVVWDFKQLGSKRIAPEFFHCLRAWGWKRAPQLRSVFPFFSISSFLFFSSPLVLFSFSFLFFNFPRFTSNPPVDICHQVATLYFFFTIHTIHMRLLFLLVFLDAKNSFILWLERLSLLFLTFFSCLFRTIF